MALEHLLKMCTNYQNQFSQYTHFIKICRVNFIPTMREMKFFVVEISVNVVWFVLQEQH